MHFEIPSLSPSKLKAIGNRHLGTSLLFSLVARLRRRPLARPADTIHRDRARVGARGLYLCDVSCTSNNFLLYLYRNRKQSAPPSSLLLARLPPPSSPFGKTGRDQRRCWRLHVPFAKFSSYILTFSYHIYVICMGEKNRTDNKRTSLLLSY